MFIANEKHNILFVNHPLSIDQVTQTIEMYIPENNKKNEYKKEKNIKM